MTAEIVSRLQHSLDASQNEVQMSGQIGPGTPVELEAKTALFYPDLQKLEVVLQTFQLIVKNSDLFVDALKAKGIEPPWASEREDEAAKSEPSTSD